MVQLRLEDISKYLTVEVVEVAFRVKTRSKDSVKKVELSRAAPAGAGLIGAVYRVKVTGESRITSFIAKGMVQDPLLRKSLQAEKCFKRESEFFSQVLPVLVNIQKSSGAKEKVQNNIPICYAYHCDGVNDFLLMEDLMESDCMSIAGMPSKCVRDAILGVLAHLHAVSMALRIKRPAEFFKLVNSMPEVYYTEERRNMYSKYLQNAIDIDLKVLAEYEDPKTSGYYKRFLDYVKNDPFGQLIQITSGRNVEHLVMNHGDAWTPNFLNSKVRAVAIDFQLMRFSTPVADLSFFTFLCINPSQNKEDFWEAIKIYYDALSYYLRDMGLVPQEVFSWDVLKGELKRYGKFGVLAAVSTIPLLSSEKCDTLDDFEEKYKGLERIPLEELWKLTPLKNEQEKLTLVNFVRVAVDTGMI